MKTSTKWSKSTSIAPDLQQSNIRKFSHFKLQVKLLKHEKPRIKNVLKILIVIFIFGISHTATSRYCLIQQKSTEKEGTRQTSEPVKHKIRRKSRKNHPLPNNGENFRLFFFSLNKFEA